MTQGNLISPVPACTSHVANHSKEETDTMNKTDVWRNIYRLLAAGSLVVSLGACNIISAQLAGRGNSNNDVQGARLAKSALMASPLVNAAPLRVSKHDNVITLSGYVESMNEKRKALEIVEKLYPEATINNDIQLR